MIGYKDVTHQGWSYANQGREESCPYPRNSTSYEDFQLGVRRFKAGHPWTGEKKILPRRQQRRMKFA